MSKKQASPLAGALVLIVLLGLGTTVWFSIRDRLHSADPVADHHTSWATAHAAPHTVVAAPAVPPRTAQSALESTPRPGAKVRTLREFYSRRAYPGAPPVIPHAVEVDGVINDDCLACHEEGGFVPEYNAYTPVTPHPQMENCRQCHVAQVTEGLFVATEWAEPELPKRGRQSIPGGPLQIPHSLQLREDCLACHSGPHAVVEIRTSHPERQNCLQCHVVDRALPPFNSEIDPRLDLADAEK